MLMIQLRNSRMLIAISLIGVIFALTAACGSSSTETVSPTLDNSSSEPELPAANPTTVPIDNAHEPMEGIEATTVPAVQSSTGSTSKEVSDTPIPATSTPTAVADETPTQAALPEPTEPPLINTPVPVANTAPDFTLPSVQGPEYTLSSFQGEQPVAVVFYRGYW
jgi:hypothetical protein